MIGRQFLKRNATALIIGQQWLIRNRTVLTGQKTATLSFRTFFIGGEHCQNRKFTEPPCLKCSINSLNVSIHAGCYRLSHLKLSHQQVVIFCTQRRNCSVLSKSQPLLYLPHRHVGQTPCTSGEQDEFLGIQRRNYSQWRTTPHSLLFLPCLHNHDTRQISAQDYEFPEIKEDDLEEKFVLGSGPGGQAVQKTANCVVLKHLPSGLIVKCHATRSLEKNRKLAREILLEQLDRKLNGPNSYYVQLEKEKVKKIQSKNAKSKKLHHKKKELKELMRQKEVEKNKDSHNGEDESQKEV